MNRNRSSRLASKIKASFAGVTVPLLAGAVVLTTPAHAAPPEWTLPDGVIVESRVQYHIDELTGEVVRTGPVGPGRTFFIGFTLHNLGTTPVTVAGFDSEFIFTMHPDRQGDYPLDHCEQFFETRDIPHRVNQQDYPVVIEPGGEAELFDNTTYHYIRGPVSNECQMGSIYYGAPVFGEEGAPDEPEHVSESQEEPPERQELPTPTPPALVTTGTAG